MSGRARHTPSSRPSRGRAGEGKTVFSDRRAGTTRRGGPRACRRRETVGNTPYNHNSPATNTGGQNFIKRKPNELFRGHAHARLVSLRTRTRRPAATVHGLKTRLSHYARHPVADTNATVVIVYRRFRPKSKGNPFAPGRLKRSRRLRVRSSESPRSNKISHRFRSVFRQIFSVA